MPGFRTRFGAPALVSLALQLAAVATPVPAQQYVGGFLKTFKEYPPSQKVGSCSLEKVMERLQAGSGG